MFILLLSVGGVLLMSFRNELSRDEILPFMEKSDVMGVWLIVFNWALMVAVFALVVVWPNVFTVLLSLILLANRQLGLAILMHECAHYSLFKTRWLNQWLGQWLCAAPILVSLDGYRRYHMQHHKFAGTTDDPDYPNYKNYPVTRDSLLRKVLRDLVGYTGLKTVYAVLLMNAGLLNYDMSYQQRSAEKRLPMQQVVLNLWRNLLPSVLVNTLMWAVLYASGHGIVYLLWPVAYLTTYMFILRIRNAAEHASVPDLLDADPRLHARTTYANIIERLLFAPNYVNYHLEHHWAPSVPCYQLGKFHRYIKEKGLLRDTEVASGYWSVIRGLVKAG